MIEITLDNVPYKMKFTLNVYLDFLESTGKDFNTLSAATLNSIIRLNGYGVSGQLDGVEAHSEMSEAILEHWTLRDIAYLFYHSAKACNSKVTFDEIQDYLFRNGISMTGDEGYQYKVLQYINYAMGDDKPVKKSSILSSLNQLFSSH